MAGATAVAAADAQRDRRADQPSRANVTAQIDSAAPLAQHNMPKPHWHKVG